MALVGVLAELQRDHLSRQASAGHVPSAGRTEAQSEPSEPAPHQVWRDGLNPAFVWAVERIDNETVFLRMYDAEAKATGSTLEWPLNRWRALVFKQGLTYVRGG